ncbi:hypothetical protein [Actinocorallia populi]|uniref:hypothetical protein n=1 Tax=Actinocorallia populi TaxID=2079200 RepID=UPI001E477F64|nr:hypothetical protein [Actinocorallia populi]
MRKGETCLEVSAGFGVSPATACCRCSINALAGRPAGRTGCHATGARTAVCGCVVGLAGAGARAPSGCWTRRCGGESPAPWPDVWPTTQTAPPVFPPPPRRRRSIGRGGVSTI